jgi:hypothetical protein
MDNESNLVKIKTGYKYFCEDPATAQALNRLLDYPYGQDADFLKSRSEGIFRFTESKLKAVLSLLKNFGQT